MSKSRKWMYLASSFLVSGALLFGSATYAHGPGQGDPNGNLEPLTAEIEQGEFGIVFEPVAEGLIAPLRKEGGARAVLVLFLSQRSYVCITCNLFSVSRSTS